MKPAGKPLIFGQGEVDRTGRAEGGWREGESRRQSKGILVGRETQGWGGA